jgi:hypothetical protein
MDRSIRLVSRWAIVPATLMALGFGSSARAADVYFACFKNTTAKVRPSSILANASPICKTGETMRTWNEEGPPGPPGQNGFASCHTEEYTHTCAANTFDVLNSSCSSGLLTGAGAI